MKSLLPFALCILWSLNTLAQNQFSGRVVDDGGNAVAYAAVVLSPTANSTQLFGDFTDNEGVFLFDHLLDQEYQLTIQMLGYEDWTQRVSLSDSTALHTIVLVEESALLEEVEVVAYRSVVESHLGKKVLRINQDLSSTGSSALEALENIPSVTTTPRGGVNIRGNSNVIIYINGKATRRDPATLRFISASSLEKIEVITNPSAKYDAEGVGGIINLVYKKDNSGVFKVELLSNVTMMTNPLNWNPIGGVNANWSKEKISLFANVSYDYGWYVNNDDAYRINFEDDLVRYDNLNTELGVGYIANALIGMSIEPDTTLSIGLEVNFDKWVFENDVLQQNIFNYTSKDQEVIEIASRKGELENELWVNASLKKTFSNKQSLKLSLTVGGEDEDNLTSSEALDLNVLPEQIEQFLLSSDEQESQRYYQGELDYETPFYGFGTLELGGRFDFIQYDILQSVDLRSTNIDVPQNDFDMDMQKLGVYIIQKHQVANLEYAIGLRLEQFSSEAIQVSNQETFKQDYTRLFPSLQLQYLIANRDHTIGFNYTKRINRPGYFDLNPYVSYGDPLNLETGNPDLRPEIADLWEFNYNLEMNKFGVDLTLYRRQTSDAIQSVLSPLDENRTLASSVNIGQERTGGIELQVGYRPFQSLKTTSSLTWFQSQFQDEDKEIFYNRQQTWGLRFMQQWQINEDWKLQLAERYRAPSYQIQRKRLEAFNVNVSVSKKLKNKRGSLSLSIRDIFNTNQFTYLLKTAELEVERRFKWQTRQINLGLRYNILNPSR